MDKRTWAEVDLDAIAHNIKEIRKITNPNAKIMAVVKADAYGHGFLEVAKTLLENGADRLAVAVLCPDHPATLALIEAAQLPLAAPSANPSGAPSPKTADDVLAYFDGQIAAVIDGGPCGIGRESTLVDLSCTPYRILRSAAVPDDAVWDALVQKMHIVGITGGTGCGKTTALMELERQGALVIDCDAVYHELLASNAAMLAEINARFPGTIENGALQRKKLGAVVFADAAALDDLNAITHRYVRAEVRGWKRFAGSLYRRTCIGSR